MENRISAYTPLSGKGFTLVEMVVAIVVMSILSIGLVQFILDSSVGYVVTAARNQLSASGRVVIDKIAMELRNAAPNSVRISSAFTSASPEVIAGNASAGDQCIEFLPVRAATTYIDPAFRPAAAVTAFTVVDFVPPQAPIANVFALIFPVNPGEIYGAGFTPPTTEAIVEVSVANADAGAPMEDGINEITSAQHRFKRRSPAQRLFLTGQPVSFCVSGGRIYRYADYGFDAVQLRPQDIGGGCSAGTCLPAATPNRVLISTEVDNGPLTDGGSRAFDQLAATRNRNAVVQLELNFSRDGEQVLLNHEVLLHSTP